MCSSDLDEAPKTHHIIVMKRGGCSFSEKLANIPSFAPTSRSLKLVVMVSDEEEGHGDGDGDSTSVHGLIRPLLDEPQVTPSGLLRHHPISMVMTGGGDKAIELLKRTKSMGLRRRYHIECQGLVVGNIIVI